jgi:hypothetical protein
MPAMPPGAPPWSPSVPPRMGRTPVPGTRVPSVVGPVQRIGEGRTPVPGSEHDCYDEIRVTEVSAEP